MENLNLCEFFSKVGSCRHGDICEKVHIIPQSSVTILLPHVWPAQQVITPQDQEQYEHFFFDLYTLCSGFGQVVDMIVSENQAPHLKGNVLVKFATEAMAAEAVKHLQGQLFSSVVLNPSYVGIIDLKESRCKQHDMGVCPKHSGCNYLHVLPIPNQFASLESYGYPSTLVKREKRLSWEIPQPQQEKNDEKSRRRGRNRERKRKDSGREYKQERISIDLEYQRMDYQEQCSLIGTYPPPNVPTYTDIYKMP
ncbi:splicing factor U2Af 38 kDa subunit, putative [Entamoeba dispar SAW760]|uniref:Splicing factor U2Af 38 kDa subunit, putative n=1 Tax=Entamoeba dispar (strain ATCC PRA-260 / SAW760) TaxID=370354 RepID=B0EET5_ENTDS|nr:splicing factor U2Af 38 kDa subunit, putative [Entamoeba dispar SAW760]EDR26968.1 splicing factor U2Af 38 kDa subunit, putative [Entamoeba dispar SAW760]|eukprot:EDR26968.1 splicing factor U2Af 38 kDa subunit, putative [Entamoeba dispar SAW760]